MPVGPVTCAKNFSEIWALVHKHTIGKKWNWNGAQKNSCCLGLWIFKTLSTSFQNPKRNPFAACYSRDGAHTLIAGEQSIESPPFHYVLLFERKLHSGVIETNISNNIKKEKKSWNQFAITLRAIWLYPICNHVSNTEIPSPDQVIFHEHKNLGWGTFVQTHCDCFSNRCLKFTCHLQRTTGAKKTKKTKQKQKPVADSERGWDPDVQPQEFVHFGENFSNFFLGWEWFLSLSRVRLKFWDPLPISWIYIWKQHQKKK